MHLVRVCYLLIALLISQSVAAFYDSHQDLQDSSTHVPAHHQDAADGSIHQDDLATADHIQPDSVPDCQHCCHCHSAGSVCLPTNAVQFLSSGNPDLRHATRFAFIEGHFSALFRPPIA
jgi:hypothetical protein